MVKLRPIKPIKLTSKSRIIGHAKARKIAIELPSLIMPELFPKGNRNNRRVNCIRGRNKMENVASMPRDSIFVVGKNFDNFVKSHREESKSALEMHKRRALEVRKNRVK